MRPYSLALVLLVTACAPVIPPFVEPEWGDAPPPRAAEVTELTLDHLACARDRCRRQVVVIQRDGAARREFYTGNGHDSTQIASIDSAAFVAIADRLIESGFFGQGGERGREHDPMSTDSWIVSGATFCRRHVGVFQTYPELRPRPAGVVKDLTEAVERLRWERLVYRL
jgi:hypothetical protein